MAKGLGATGAEGAERRGRGASRKAEHDDKLHKGADGAGVQGTAPPVPNKFAPDAVLLVGEDEAREGGPPKDCERGAARIQLAHTDPETNVAEAERVWFVPADTILTGSHQVEEGDVRHVAQTERLRCVASYGLGEDGVNDLDGDWFYSGGRRVLFLVGAELPANPKVHLSIGVQPGVGGPHPGERLANGPEVRLSSTCSYLGAVVREVASPNAVGKNLEERNRVRELGEVG